MKKIILFICLTALAAVSNLCAQTSLDERAKASGEWLSKLQPAENTLIKGIEYKNNIYFSPRDKFVSIPELGVEIQWRDRFDEADFFVLQLLHASAEEIALDGTSKPTETSVTVVKEWLRFSSDTLLYKEGILAKDATNGDVYYYRVFGRQEGLELIIMKNNQVLYDLFNQDYKTESKFILPDFLPGRGFPASNVVVEGRELDPDYRFYGDDYQAVFPDLAINVSNQGKDHSAFVLQTVYRSAMVLSVDGSAVKEKARAFKLPVAGRKGNVTFGGGCIMDGNNCVVFIDRKQDDWRFSCNVKNFRSGRRYVWIGKSLVLRK